MRSVNFSAIGTAVSSSIFSIDFSIGGLLTTGLLAAGVGLTTQSSVSAQAAYGSYIGFGPSVSLTRGGGTNEGNQAALAIAARYKFLELPISARVQAFLFSGTVAIIPTVSYDLPINWQTDIYLGIGYAFTDGGSPSPIGNRSSLVFQPGIDYALPNSNLVLFGNALYSLDAYKGGGVGLSIQAGVGLRF